MSKWNIESVVQMGKVTVVTVLTVGCLCSESVVTTAVYMSAGS